MAERYIGRIVVWLHLDEDGDEIIRVENKTDIGGTIPVVTAVGMLYMAADELLHPPD